MAKKQSTVHTCTECGYMTAKWLGRCPECGSWGTLSERSTPTAAAQAIGTNSVAPSSPAIPISAVSSTEGQRTPTGISELDRVLGGGLVHGSVILLAGEPGVGKSTLLLEVASRWAQEEDAAQPKKTRKSLYITAEESIGQVKLRAERTGTVEDTLFLASEADLDVIFGHVAAIKPSLLIVDSVQTVRAPGVDGIAGGVTQSRAVTAGLTALAKSSGVPVILVGHVTKDGTVAGPRVLEHLVDAVFNFEGDKHSSLRFLRSMKNRYGATDEVGCFTQLDAGIREVPDPSGLFLAHRDHTPDGAAVTVAMDGLRPLPAEVQALTVKSSAGNPRRAVTGLDSTRVPMVLAVLQARENIKVSDSEVYLATVGGMKVTEPAADLAIALAVVSSTNRVPLPDRTVIIGEVGLAGEIRPVPDLGRRLKEAARLGYTQALVPASGDTLPRIAGMRITRAATVAQAIAAMPGQQKDLNPNLGAKQKKTVTTHTIDIHADEDTVTADDEQSQTPATTKPKSGSTNKPKKTGLITNRGGF